MAQVLSPLKNTVKQGISENPPPPKFGGESATPKI